jgi:hypothetical protein
VQSGAALIKEKKRFWTAEKEKKKKKKKNKLVCEFPPLGFQATAGGEVMHSSTLICLLEAP